MGWRSHRLGPWPLRLKLGLTPSNRRHADGTHDDEMSKLRIRNRGLANDPRDSRRKDKLIMGCRFSIDINERENEVRRKVYGKILNEGKQKVSMRLGNRVIVRQRMKNECHHHVKEPRTFCKARAWSVLTITL